VGVTGSRPARRPKTFPSGDLPADRTRTAAAACAAAAPAPTGAGRRRRAASTRRGTGRRAGAGVRKGLRRSARRRLLGQDHSGAGRRSRTGRPTTCSTSAPAASAGSHQPLVRVAATRCAVAPKATRSSDEAPPWQRGPVGRRGGAERKERCEDDMAQAFESPRGGNISLQGFARAVRSATTVPAEWRDKRRMTPGDLRCAQRCALTRPAVARRAASNSQAAVTTGPSSQRLEAR
jgi:hypothetical protein